MSALSAVDEEDLKIFENKVNNVMRLLQEISTGGKDADAGMREQKPPEDFSNMGNINKDNFIVTVRDNRTVINRKEPEPVGPQQMDKFAFMRQMEDDAQKRADNRKEREAIAENFRYLGNQAYQEEQFEKAVNMYSKAIDQVKDSIFLYNNRALAYISLGLYKRAIFDVDFVLHKLDEKNLNAWMYRARAFYHLMDDTNFQNCIKMAKKHHLKEAANIDKFILNLREGAL